MNPESLVLERAVWDIGVDSVAGMVHDGSASQEGSVYIGLWIVLQGCRGCSEPADTDTAPDADSPAETATETGADTADETGAGSGSLHTGETAAPPVEGTPLPEGAVHGMWVWATWDATCLTPSGAICYGGETDCTTSKDAPCEALPSVWFDESLGSGLVSAAAFNGVSPLYTSTYYPRGRTIQVSDESYEALLYQDAELQLVVDAQAEGIEVWAMMSLGDADLDPQGFHDAHADGVDCEPEAVNEPLHRILDVLRFNASDGAFEFDGLYIDLEPDIEGLASDEDAMAEDALAMAAVLDLLACAQTLVGEADLPLATTVSWRWDGALTFQGTTASMADHLYALGLDHYVVVPYAHQIDRLLERAEPLYTAAASAGVFDRVAIATETQDCSITSACDDATTFYPCGHWGYVRVLQDVVSRLDALGEGTNSAARGVVTHAYQKAYLSGDADWPTQATLKGETAWPPQPAECDPAP